MDTEKEIEQIKLRNQKVETDKAWEESWTRKVAIAFFTYLIAAVWLVLIKDTNSLLKAFVPAGGYLLSTLSIPWVQKFWARSKRL